MDQKELLKFVRESKSSYSQSYSLLQHGKFAPVSITSNSLLVLYEDVKYGTKGKGGEFDGSRPLLMVWLKYEVLYTFPSQQDNLKLLALKWNPFEAPR